MSDLSVPPSPTSDSSSEPRSPSGTGGLVEPMDLSDFIGSLNEARGSNNGAKNKTREERRGSIRANKDVDNNGKEKEWRRLLDRDYNYQQYVCADDFDLTQTSVPSIIPSSTTSTGK